MTVVTVVILVTEGELPSPPGASHAVDSNELSFRLAAKGALRQGTTAPLTMDLVFHLMTWQLWTPHSTWGTTLNFGHHTQLGAPHSTWGTTLNLGHHT